MSATRAPAPVYDKLKALTRILPHEGRFQQGPDGHFLFQHTASWAHFSGASPRTACNVRGPPRTLLSASGSRWNQPVISLPTFSAARRGFNVGLDAGATAGHQSPRIASSHALQDTVDDARRDEAVVARAGEAPAPPFLRKCVLFFSFLMSSPLHKN
jgi:hypothetical protein